MATLKLPAKKEMIGILLSADSIEVKGSEIVLISIQDADDEIITISTSPAYWKKVGKLFPVDSTIKVSYENRIKDVTGYAKDSAKPTELTKHESDGNNLVGITRFSTSAFERMMLKNTVNEAVAQLQAVEVERVDAISNFLGRVYGK